jgi:AraC family transcriptional regulator
MFRAVEFIEANLKEEIGVADMAEAVTYSLYHFCRVFSQVVHHSPYDYLMRRRLSECARELLRTEQKITDIAFDYQFNSHETFSRAFKRMFKMQPNQWKRQGTLDRRCLLSKPTLAYLEHLDQGDYLNPVFVEKNTLHLAGVISLVKDDKTVVAELWKILAQALAGIKNSLKPPRYYGLTWYPPRGEGCFYMAATEIEAPVVSHPVLVVKTVPPGPYARFIHRGPTETLPLTLDYIYQTWLPKSGRSLAHPLELESFGEDFCSFDQKIFQREIYIPIE